MQDGVYKQIASVEQSEIHFSHASTMIHVDSDEARRQLAKSKFAKKKPQMKESGTGTDRDDTATGEGDGAEKTEDEGTGDDAEAAGKRTPVMTRPSYVSCACVLMMIMMMVCTCALFSSAKAVSRCPS